MKQSSGVRRSLRSKKDKLSSKFTHSGETISEKFQIGLDKYVHDVQFYQSFEANNMALNVEENCKTLIKQILMPTLATITIR